MFFEVRSGNLVFNSSVGLSVSFSFSFWSYPALLTSEESLLAFRKVLIKRLKFIIFSSFCLILLLLKYSSSLLSLIVYITALSYLASSLAVLKSFLLLETSLSLLGVLLVCIFMVLERLYNELSLFLGRCFDCEWTMLLLYSFRSTMFSADSSVFYTISGFSLRP